MEYAGIKHYADCIVTKFRPVCNRIEIAGSIRREKADCGDIEIVAIPSPAYLDKYRDLMAAQRIAKGQPLGKMVVFDYCGVQVDFFTATRDTWGYILAIRTGPWAYSRELVMNLKKKGFDCNEGRVYNKTKFIPTPEEQVVFFMAGMEYKEPHDRA